MMGNDNIIEFYTTSIIYNLNFSCYDDDVKKRKAERIGSRKEKDMNTMNRLYSFYKECCQPAHLDEHELGLCFVHSSIDKHKRGNCVLYTCLQ